jgi:hypothetical protein
MRGHHVVLYPDRGVLVEEYQFRGIGSIWSVGGVRGVRVSHKIVEDVYNVMFLSIWGFV